MTLERGGDLIKSNAFWETRVIKISVFALIKQLGPDLSGRVAAALISMTLKQKV